MSRFEFDAPATPDNLARIRTALCEWLETAQLHDQLISDIVLAVNEASTNCVEHAYHGRPGGSMRVEADHAGGEVRIRVIDAGSWKTPDTSSRRRGRGLTLVHAVSDTIVVHEPGGGTSVVMRFGMRG